MIILILLISLFALLCLASLITALVCFIRIFYSPRQKKAEDFPIPEGKIYEEYREDMIRWIKEADALPYIELSITSFDGLKLKGRFYEFEKNAPVEILFHGYKGSSRRDLSGGVARCRALGHSALIVDHRASGESEGRVITFGIKESRDCLSWIDLVSREVAPEAKIIITGISMGAATVMITAAEELPEKVVGVLADCGYTSAKDIIKKVIKDMGLPAELLYPFAKLGARIFGGFDLEERSPAESMKKCRIPVIFFHGDSDDFVPHSMSVENYEACVAKKELVTISGAGHGLCFPADREKYLNALRAFFDPITAEQ